MTDKAEDVIDSLHEAEGLLGNECECMNHEDFCSWCSACKAVENARDLLASQAAEIEKLYTTNTRFGDVIASQAAEIERLETIIVDESELVVIDHDRQKEIERLRAENNTLRADAINAGRLADQLIDMHRSGWIVTNSILGASVLNEVLGHLRGDTP